MVVLRTFASRHEAELAGAILEANGVAAVVSSDDAGGMQPWMQGLLGVRLLVRHEDALHAGRLLDASSGLEPD
jgi:hypothetical protein